jgi:GTPase Era involved in 16S rRNA processing
MALDDGGTYAMTVADVARQLITLLEAAEDSDRLAAARLLHQRLCSPESIVSVVGETSTGKSTLVNSLIGRQILPTAAEPTTATVTEIFLGEFEHDRFLAIFRDATQGELDKAGFDDLARRPPKDLLRLQVRTQAADARSVGLHVFDTPGYNSVLAEHEEVLRQFLPQSDVVVFVAGYRTGFGQADQDLLEMVQTATEDDASVPVLLVVNRAARSVTNDDSRVWEIMANARDSLRRELEMILVRSATEFVALGPEADCARSTLPDASSLWDRVKGIVSSEERQIAVQRKLKDALRDLIDDADQAFERVEMVLAATVDEAAAIDGQIRALEDARSRSLQAVAVTADRMRVQLPKSLDHLAASMRTKLNKDIEGSDMWLGRDECVAWVSAHALPFEVRQVARSIEESISVELQELDRQLCDIANTAVREVEKDVHIKSDASRRFVENLGRVVAQRLGGAGINALLRSVGGVGGAAAGAGNVVKMLVSRMGSLLGKTFSREVYTQIGKTFTKRTLARLNVAISIIIEVLGFVIDAHRWRGQLTGKVAEAIDGWASDVRTELLDQHLPRIQAQNDRGVRAVYDPIIDEGQKSLRLRSEGSAPKRAQLALLRAELNRVREALSRATFRR